MDTGTGSSARTILYLMAFATGIALVGHTFEPRRSTKLTPGVGDAQILLGGVAATVILTLLAQAGEVGQRFGKGVALIALLSSLGYYGGPVFDGLSRLTGQATRAPLAGANPKPAPTKTGATK